jgi:hypothetical protein
MPRVLTPKELKEHKKIIRHLEKHALTIQLKDYIALLRANVLATEQRVDRVDSKNGTQ